MGMPELVWWRAFLGIGTLRCNTISIKRNVNIRTGYVTLCIYMLAWKHMQQRFLTIVHAGLEKVLMIWLSTRSTEFEKYLRQCPNKGSTSPCLEK